METTKVLTSLLVLTLTGPTLGYPFSRGSSGRARDRQVLDSDVADYLGTYVQDQQYALPEYQPAYRHEYATPQRQRINAEALAALLPYLTANNEDYAYDYNTYSDDDGTWYDGAANDEVSESSDGDNAALLQFLLDHHSGRYSLEDLETLEREAEMEDNSENQLHALMRKQQMNKKSTMPLLGVRQMPRRTPVFRRGGQKEEALDIPSTPVRRPVFATEISTQPAGNEAQIKRSAGVSNVNSHKTSSSSSAQQAPASSQDKTSPAPASSTDDSSSRSSSSSSISSSKSSSVANDLGQTTMTPYMQSKYDAFMKYLERERKVRQDQDIENELQQEIKAQPQKRFVSEQDVLSQELASLKKTVA